MASSLSSPAPPLLQPAPPPCSLPSRASLSLLFPLRAKSTKASVPALGSSHGVSLLWSELAVAHGALPFSAAFGSRKEQRPFLLSHDRRSLSSSPHGASTSLRALSSLLGAAANHHGASLYYPRRAAQQPSAPLLKLPRWRPEFQQRASSHGRPHLCCCRAPAPASSHGTEDSLRASTSPMTRPRSTTPLLHPPSERPNSTLPYSPFFLPTKQQPQRARRRPWRPLQSSPLAVPRNARGKYCVVRSSPRRLRALLARCFAKPSGQHAVDAHRVFAVLRSPIRDAVENRGETPRSPCCYHIFLVCSVKMLNRCVCLIAASCRRHASRLARSTKCQAMWIAHASSHDSFRLIDL
jgi:hypothetical protein